MMAIPEDRFSNTVADAAAYEAYRSRGDYDAVAEARADARADAAYDARAGIEPDVEAMLETLVEAECDRLRALEQQIIASGVDPHPWTEDRHLIALWNEDEDAFCALLDERFLEEAEEAAEEAAEAEYEEGPCCNDFSCPCGNSNSFRGF
jgi:hypothetical protein